MSFLNRTIALSRRAVSQTAVSAPFAGRAQAVRSLAGYVQPPQELGAGAKEGSMPTDKDQATGRERAELDAAEKGIEYFTRKPVQMMSYDEGTFANPILVPSAEHDRIIGMVPKGQDGPIWFEIKDDGVYYCEDVDLHFKLHDPTKK